MKVVAENIFFRVHLICDFGNSQLFEFLLLLFWLGDKEDTLKKKTTPQNPKNKQKNITPNCPQVICFKMYLVIETRQLQAWAYTVLASVPWS